LVSTAEWRSRHRRPDRRLRGAADRLERALATNGVDHDVKEYPDAGHSFLNDHDPSAEDARRRIVSFFKTHLKVER
jgi:carboxymethylenebutenolidase